MSPVHILRTVHYPMTILLVWAVDERGYTLWISRQPSSGETWGGEGTRVGVLPCQFRAVSRRWLGGVPFPVATSRGYCTLYVRHCHRIFVSDQSCCIGEMELHPLSRPRLVGAANCCTHSLSSDVIRVPSHQSSGVTRRSYGADGVQPFLRSSWVLSKGAVCS